MKNNSYCGFSLLEFLIASVLTMILLSAASSAVMHFLKSFYELAVEQNLFYEAELITQIFKQNLSSQAQWTCQDAGNFKSPLKIYLAENAIELPQNVQRKLLPHSSVIQQNDIEKPIDIALRQQEPDVYQVVGGQQQLAQQDMVLLFNCQRMWLFDLRELWHRQNQTWIKVSSDLNIPPHENFLLAKWKITWWFVMKNNHGDYGLYRLILPYERAPVELIDHVKMMHVSQVDNRTEIHLDLAEAKQKLHWLIKL